MKFLLVEEARARFGTLHAPAGAITTFLSFVERDGAMWEPVLSEDPFIFGALVGYQKVN